MSVLRSKLTSEKRIFLKIALDAIEYLENHEIDPGNLFVGTPPSDFVSKSLVPIISISNLNEQTTTNPSSSFPSSSPFSSTASLSSTQPKTEMNLQKQIMRWKALKNHPEQIEEEINQTVQHLLETQPKAMVGLVAVQISSIPRPYQFSFLFFFVFMIHFPSFFVGEGVILIMILYFKIEIKIEKNKQQIMVYESTME